MPDESFPFTQNKSEAILDVQNVSQMFQRNFREKGALVLENISLTLRPREMVAMLGRSGSGKSSLLRIMAGLIRPSSGQVFYKGRNIHESWGRDSAESLRCISMVFQSFALFPWLSVLENVELGLRALKVPFSEGRRRALEALDIIGLDGFESAYPKELSGGMRQRVGFARALVTHPNVLLMDEPFSALDVLTSETLRTDLLDLWWEERLPIQTIFMVTHNIEEAVLMCDRILILSSNPGRIAAEIVVDLPRARNRLDPAFRQFVDKIYARMTQREEKLENRTLTAGLPATSGIGMVLPRISTNTIAGFLETLNGLPFNGRADLPHLADELTMEIDDLFPVTETLHLLRFAEVEEGDIKLLTAGKRFAELDVDARKKLFGEHLLVYLPLAAHIRKILDERPHHYAPASRFRQELEDYMSEDYADKTLRAVTNWGRYGEIFAYDEHSQIFSLENP